MEYGFEFINNHTIVEIDGGFYVVDTGSPISFFVDGKAGVLAINEMNFNLKNNPRGIDRNATEALIGRTINGFIGMDILKTMGSLYLNKAKEFAVFGGTQNYLPANEIKTEYKSVLNMGFIQTTVGINGNAVPAILDSGDCTGYISKRLARGCEAIGRISDYNPQLGNIETYSINVNLSLNNNEIPATIGVMTTVMEQLFNRLGYEAIFGFGLMQWNELLLDIAGNRLCYT